MFTILNRLRGTWGWFSKVVGILIAVMVYLCSDNYYVATAAGLGYVLGESFGWGAWVGTLSCRPRNSSVQSDTTEGRNNGIFWLASRVYNPKTEWYNFSIVALAIRGVYWWLPVAIPLVYLYGYYIPLISAIVLGVLFPVAAVLGYRFRNLNVIGWTGGWEIQELIYGIMQDSVIGIGVLIWIGFLG